MKCTATNTSTRPNSIQKQQQCRYKKLINSSSKNIHNKNLNFQLAADAATYDNVVSRSEATQTYLKWLPTVIIHGRCHFNSFPYSYCMLHAICNMLHFPKTYLSIHWLSYELLFCLNNILADDHIEHNVYVEINVEMSICVIWYCYVLYCIIQEQSSFHLMNDS